MSHNILKNANILIVDDLLENLKLFKEILATEGCMVRPTMNGELALKAAQTMPPDLILLDIKMPKMDGFEVCRRLKANNITKEIPIIFLTAKANTDDIVKGFELGAEDYITKPFRTAEVLSRIRTHLELNFSRKKIEEQNQKQRELIHLLCHDLMNSIGSVNSITDIVKMEKKELSEHDLMIQEASNNALEIINLVRQLSGLEEGKLKVELMPLNLKDLIEQTLVIVEERFHKKNVQAIVKIPEDMVVNVEQTSFVNSVIANLLTNAVKFSFSGSEVMITAKESEDEIVLAIEDFGIGMPQYLCNNVFKVNKATTRPGTHGETGTGFGMPLVKQFIEIYGGTIDVVSYEKRDRVEKHGTKFFIYLPKVSVTNAESE